MPPKAVPAIAINAAMVWTMPCHRGLLKYTLRMISAKGIKPKNTVIITIPWIFAIVSDTPSFFDVWTVADMSAMATTGTPPVPTAFVRSIWNEPYAACIWVSAFSEFDLRSPLGPIPNMKSYFVLFGSIEDPFQERQFEHIALTVIVLSEMPVPGNVMIVIFLAIDGSEWSCASRGLRVIFLPVESLYMMKTKEFSIRAEPIPTACDPVSVYLEE